MMKESLKFQYNGIHSDEMGVIQINTGKGLFEESFLPDRDIKEVSIKGRSKSYFQGVEYKPLEFSLSFYFEDGYDSDKVRKVARWLCQDYYKPLIFEANPNQIFYCICVTDSKLIHNGLQEGYVELTMKCNDAYRCSHYMTSDLYEIDTEGQVEFRNDGDVVVKPEITITKTGKGKLEIHNLSNANEVFVFESLEDNETVYIDNEDEYIESDLPLSKPYEQFNDNYLDLDVGMNHLLIKGSCELQFRYRFKFLQG